MGVTWRRAEFHIPFTHLLTNHKVTNNGKTLITGWLRIIFQRHLAEYLISHQWDLWLLGIHTSKATRNSGRAEFLLAMIAMGKGSTFWVLIMVFVIGEYKVLTYALKKGCIMNQTTEKSQFLFCRAFRCPWKCFCNYLVVSIQTFQSQGSFEHCVLSVRLLSGMVHAQRALQIPRDERKGVYGLLEIPILTDTKEKISWMAQSSPGCWYTWGRWEWWSSFTTGISLGCIFNFKM